MVQQIPGTTSPTPTQPPLQKRRESTLTLPGNFYFAVARGLIPGHVGVHLFGTSDNVDSGVKTDLWDRANATDDQDIFTAPTTARIHQIVSSSTSDDGSPVGVGARTIEVRGLTSWDTKEVEEEITMNGTTNVPTVNAYVMINHMEVLTKGATSANVGVIKATADTDSTVTAQINAGNGHTLTTVYGVPSIQDLYVLAFSVTVGAAASGKEVEVDVLTNLEPDVELLNFIIDFHVALNASGTGHIHHTHILPDKHPGPVILKMQATGDAANMSVDGSFEIVLVDKNP